MKKAHSISWQILALILFGILSIAYLVFTFVRGGIRVFTSTGLPSPMTTFESKQFHFSINYPKSWGAVDLPDGNHGDHEVITVIAFAGVIPAPTVTIAQRSFESPTLDDVAKWGESRITAVWPQGELLSNGSFTQYNNKVLIRYYFRPSRRFFWMVTDKCLDWYTIKGSTGYDLSFCSHQNYWTEDMEKVFLQMAQSFEVH